VPIYKILLPSEWAEFEALGRFDGSPFDARSGFIHCSSRAQVGATALRFFAEAPALVVVTLDESAIGEEVRWEPASDGEHYPHVYGQLPRGAVLAVHHLAGASSVDEALPAD
jgi:uncharacterized protein (DUF952 family)